MKKVKFYCNTTAISSGKKEEVFEFDDDATDKEIEESLANWVYEVADSTYSVIEEIPDEE